MLPSGNRMRRRDDFTLAVRRGRRAGRPTVVVHLLQPDENTGADAAPLVGFIVARTVGNAVVRNSVRRRLRHLVRPHLDRLPAGSLLVVRANPRAGTARPDETAADLESALDRLLRPASKGRR
ncbi:ribonuclease P protein component [Actinomadura welshii]|uniref:Ribonuclease P protein component n=3 Tax=Actinomadura livida TaxID=79909 RepID=A0A7W7N2G0_9ACTN|nr:ribonuclease P protein component [Actinomadura catellatispora]MBB4778987.1 ribonuclease P protein component [Actinomadura catellatispora]